MQGPIHLFVGMAGKNHFESYRAIGSIFHTALSFVQGHSEGVTYPRHLSSTQVSILFIVPLWETTPEANKSNMVLAYCVIS